MGPTSFRRARFAGASCSAVLERTRAGTRATKLFDRKEEAVEAARKTARQQKSVLIVHRKDGTVQEVRNYRSG